MKLNNDKFYKILHEPSGLFKASGHNSKFNKHGKIWRGSLLKNHLRMFEPYRRSNEPFLTHLAREWGVDPSNCLIIEYDLAESNCESLSVFVDEEMS